MRIVVELVLELVLDAVARLAGSMFGGGNARDRSRRGGRPRRNKY